ncbi:gp205 [Bacillus phage W.Ph.]|uniref:Gp205 n=1 Tax=Bacillus phage W.Ph. TaxID=764595 RepID=G9B1V6_9CAUD|nr:gp205 [Bacillus phage W.Ph.]ADH03351.1 gp205 [Bacillus phage W.Ph.]
MGLTILQLALLAGMVLVCPIILYIACVMLETNTFWNKMFVGVVIALTLAGEVILYASFKMLSNI